MSPVFLLPGPSFFDDLAARILEQQSPAVAAGDLSGLRVLVPAMPMAAELRAALVRVAPGALLLPRIDTLKSWAQSVILPGLPEALPASRRLLLLHEALREKGWFDERALWGIASEMAALFDELTAASVNLPEDADALTAQLEKAYALRASTALAFEARVVHELWRALSTTGAVDAAALYRMQLGELARQPQQPLWLLLDAAPDEALDAAERDFLVRYGAQQSVSIACPTPREAAATPLLALLDAAWPQTLEMPLIERAHGMAQRHAESPLAGRLQLVSCNGREDEAQAAVAQIGQWLQAGLRRVALVAQDRLTARRVRALLERENVLVSDETGWLLSTSRAAAAVDAVLEVVAGNAYHRDLLDLCKSSFVFADVPERERKAAVTVLETAIRGASVKAGLPRVRRAVLQAGAPETPILLPLLDRLEAVHALIQSKPVTLARWIGRLLKALEALGAVSALRADTAGAALLELLETRQQELADGGASFTLSAWRDWLNRELEAASFRDASLVSPVVVTPLNAMCLRRFEAALLIGGDQRHLAATSPGAFFNQSVRRELGLRTQADGVRELRRDLELLLATVPQVVVSWQAEHDGEANLLAAEFLSLSSLHALAWGDSLHRPALPARPDVAAEVATAPARTQAAAPHVPRERVPQRVSVSGYASLVACPYRFFVRHVLRLGEVDEVSEAMEKSDYGALVHQVLERFHAAHPRLSALSDGEALAALQEGVEAVFAPAVEENFLATGWRLRWNKRLPAYLAWQRQREAAGWCWSRAETKVARAFALADGSALELYGRIDRTDVRGDGEEALIDYKTQTAKAIRDRLDNDVQLPAYALIHGHAGEAAYVALDDEAIITVSCSETADALMEGAAAQGRRLVAAFDALRAGAALPAHGAESVCQWCEGRGVCRRDYVDR